MRLYQLIPQSEILESYSKKTHSPGLQRLPISSQDSEQEKHDLSNNILSAEMKIVTQSAWEMFSHAQSYIKAIDYNFWEYNCVPEKWMTNHSCWNMMARLFFRLSPINFRPSRPAGTYPVLPQSLNALLLAYDTAGDRKSVELLFSRLLKLRSPLTQNFALSQGTRISISLYDDEADVPTPLWTAWFANYLLKGQYSPITQEEKHKLLLSIADYFIYDLQYQDFGEQGIYFFYGHSLKDRIIYNASAIVSSVLLKIGWQYQISKYIELGQRGIKYIVESQNADGSWFYAAPPAPPAIDSFHQAYIMTALQETQLLKPTEKIQHSLDTAIEYYRNTFFKKKGQYVIPKRFDKRFTPKNTWILQNFDGRDLAEAVHFFSSYHYNEEMLSGLLLFLHDYLYDEKKGFFYPEKLLGIRNKIPYLEFQGWYLVALTTFLKKVKEI